MDTLDITAIHSDLHIENSESIHAIMCKSPNELDIYNDESVSLLKKTFIWRKLSYQIKGNSYNIEGDNKRTTSERQPNTSSLPSRIRIINKY